MCVRINLLITLLFALTTRAFSQINNLQITEQSLQSIYVEVYRGNHPLASATAFIIRSKTRNYLITNWHVVTNKRPVTGAWIDTSVRIAPDRIMIAHNSKIIGNHTVRTEPLSFEGGIFYKQFVINNEMVDVVALPLTDTLGDIAIYPVDYQRTTEDIIIKPTQNLFVIGYPLGMTSASSLPIWKSGTIASEPDIDQENKPIIWVDLQGFGGMSGSPVYLIVDEYVNKRNNSMYLPGRPSTFFMGVFSHGAVINIGAVWKATYLKQLFNTLP